MFDDDYYDEYKNYDSDDEFFQAFYDSCNDSNSDFESSNRHHLNGYDDDDEPMYHLKDDRGRTHSFYTESEARNYFYQHEDDFEDQSY